MTALRGGDQSRTGVDPGIARPGLHDPGRQDALASADVEDRLTGRRPQQLEDRGNRDLSVIGAAPVATGSHR